MMAKMKAVLISVQPKWCELIASGRKTIEVRKTRPKIETPFKCYIYCTKGSRHIAVLQNSDGISTTFCCDWRSAIPCQCEIANGQVIGEFVCDRIEKYRFSNYEAQYSINDIDQMAAYLNHPQLIQYDKGNPLYGWHISDLKIYDKPKELGEFWAYNAELHERFANEEDFCCYNGTNEYGELLNECAIFNTDIKRCYSCWEEWSGWCHRIKRPPQSWCYVEEEK